MQCACPRLLPEILFRPGVSKPDDAGGQEVSELSSVAEEGVLVRQVLASADRKTWLGPAGYALARNSKWGDLWPSYYINRAIISKIGHGSG